MATLGIAMQVPVVSMKSIMELMNGRAVTSQTDLLAMRKFVQNALDSNNMVQYIGMDGYSMPADGALPGYVTCGSVCVCDSTDSHSIPLGMSTGYVYRPRVRCGTSA